MTARTWIGALGAVALAATLTAGPAGAQDGEEPTPKRGAQSTFADPPARPESADDQAPSLAAMAGADGTVEVIVGVDAGLDPVATVASVAGTATEAVRPVIDGVALVEVDAEQLARLDADPRITTLERNAPLELSLAESNARIGADVARTSGRTGAGRRIAIIDSGIDSSHPTFPPGAISESEAACFVWDIDVPDPCPDGSPDHWGAGAAAPCSSTDCGHGTHVASIAAGRGSPGLQPGVAPGAEIIPIRIFYTAPHGRSTAETIDLIRALEYVATLDLADPIDAVNLSLGEAQSDASGFCHPADSMLTEVVDRLRRQGVVVVAATGNDGGSDGVAVPACIAAATPVTATLDTSDAVWAGSDTGSVVSLAAPGTSITGAWPGGGTRTLDGTSMAAPQVAGAVALLRAQYGERSVNWIEERLWSTGVSVTDPTNGLQLRRIDVAAALGLRPVQSRPPTDVVFAVTNAGDVLTTGSALHWGDAPARAWGELIVAGSATRSGMGYWLVSNFGRVFAYGDAAFHGDMSGTHLNGPITAMATTPSGGGYWLLGSDGGIFTFGDAKFHGSTGAMRLNAPVTDLAPTPTGAGYWLTAKDGGVFSFGDARFYGSTGNMRLNRPVVSMAAHPTRGYWLVALDGGVFSFSVPFHGSLPGSGVSTDSGHRVRATAGGRGYYITTRDGGVRAFGAATAYGDTPPLGPYVELVDLMIPPA